MSIKLCENKGYKKKPYVFDWHIDKMKTRMKKYIKYEIALGLFTLWIKLYFLWNIFTILVIVFSGKINSDACGIQTTTT